MFRCKGDAHHLRSVEELSITGSSGYPASSLVRKTYSDLRQRYDKIHDNIRHEWKRWAAL